jgi:streptogramin lyase
MKTMPERLLTLVVAVCMALLASGNAHAAPAVDGEFAMPAGGKPGYITQGPDGNVWAVLSGAVGGEDVAKIEPDGTVTGYDVPLLTGAVGIAAGPNGYLWVTRPAKAARFLPANPAGAEEFNVAGLGAPRDIVLGPDDNLWAASGDTLMKIPPDNPAGYTPYTILTMDARGIASDGERLWIASFGNGTVYSATTAGVPTPYVVGGGPQEVAGGLGGQAAFTNPGTSPQTVGRLTSGGAPLTTDTPSTDPFGIAPGADQAYWIAQFLSGDIGRLTADGQYSVLTGLSPGSGPRHITAGPGNTLWVSLETAGKVARISGLEPPVPAQPAQPISSIAPVVSKLRLSAKRFRVGKARTPVAAQKRRGKRVAVGTTIRFALSAAADVRISFERKAAGRRHGGRCVKPKRRLRSKKLCTRWVKAGKALTRRSLGAGRQKVAFSGRIGRRALKPGGYRLTIVATGAAGAKSKPKRVVFTVVQPRT